MPLGRVLLVLSSVTFAASGLAYMVAPGAALGVVGVEPTATTEFLLRTEGVALLFGAAMLAAVQRNADATSLAAVAAYFVLSSVVDAVAYAQGIVGPASVPSVAIRLLTAGVCLVAAARSVRGPEALATPPR